MLCLVGFPALEITKPSEICHPEFEETVTEVFEVEPVALGL